MKMTLMELAATNAALLAYRNELRELMKVPAATPENGLSTRTLLATTQAALEKVQEQVRKQAETYR